nr:MAG TPA: hypothetical protein [Caudoviricetes sp.]
MTKIRQLHKYKNFSIWNFSFSRNKYSLKTKC